MAAKLLKGTAFLTGAGSGIYPAKNTTLEWHQLTRTGIGRATAIAFARSGIQRLALTDRNLDAVDAVSKEIRSQYPCVEILTYKVDVTDTGAVEGSVLEAVKKFGRIDVAVNVAGVSQIS